MPGFMVFGEGQRRRGAMTTLEWSEAVEVHVAAFDEDHHSLIDKAAALVAACEEGQPALAQQNLLDDFIEISVDHFEREEMRMHEVDFPEFTNHKAEHDLLIRAILKFRADLRYGRLPADAAAEIIADWLLRHIREWDKGYTDFFHARGIR